MSSSSPDQFPKIFLPLREGLHREDLPPDAFDLLLCPAVHGCERSDHVQMFRRDSFHLFLLPTEKPRIAPRLWWTRPVRYLSQLSSIPHYTRFFVKTDHHAFFGRF